MTRFGQRIEPIIYPTPMSRVFLLLSYPRTHDDFDPFHIPLLFIFYANIFFIKILINMDIFSNETDETVAI